jgi:hypothetical protein
MVTTHTIKRYKLPSANCQLLVNAVTVQVKYYFTSLASRLIGTYLTDGFIAAAGALACISWFILRLRTAAA